MVGWRRAIVLVAAVGVLSGCVGAQSRAEFETLVQERGGGASATTIDTILTDLTDRVGDDAQVRTGRINFGAGTAVFEIRTSARPDELDSYRYRNESFAGADPVRLSSDDDLDSETTPLSAFDLASIETIADRALVEFDSSGGYVTGVSLIGVTEPPLMRVDVESPRSSGTAVFGADGEFVEFER